MAKKLIVKQEKQEDVEIDLLDSPKKDMNYHIKKGTDGLHFKTQKSVETWAKRKYGPGAKFDIS